MDHTIKSSQVVVSSDIVELPISSVIINGIELPTLTNSFSSLEIVDVIITESGDLAFVATSPDDGDGKGAYFGLIDPINKVVKSFSQLNSSQYGDQTASALDQLADGSFVVAFLDGGTSNGKFYLQKIDSSGHLIGDNVLIMPPPDSSTIHHATLASLPSGELLVASSAKQNDTNKYFLKIATFDSDLNETVNFQEITDDSNQFLSFETKGGVTPQAISTTEGIFLIIRPKINENNRFVLSLDDSLKLSAGPYEISQSRRVDYVKAIKTDDGVFVSLMDIYDEAAIRGFSDSGSPVTLNIPVLNESDTERSRYIFNIIGVENGFAYFTSSHRYGDFRWPVLDRVDITTGAVEENLVNVTETVYNYGVSPPKINIKGGFTDDENFSLVFVENSQLKLQNIHLNSQPVGSFDIFGEHLEDQTLQINIQPMDLDGIGEMSYTWTADGKELAEISNELLLTQDHVGASIQAIVSYVDDNGTLETITFDPTEPISNINDLPQGNISLSGEHRESELLSIVTDIVDDDGIGDFSYQWYRNDELIEGAVNESYRLQQFDVGNKIKASITYIDDFGTTEIVLTEPTEPIANVNNPAMGNVIIGGTALEGELLSVDTSKIDDQDGLGDFVITWLSDGSPISLATESQYELSRLDVGKKISAQVSFTDGYGYSETIVSAPTQSIDNINIPVEGTISIVGDRLQGATLTVIPSISDADGLPSQYTYKWLRDGTPISNANDQTYTLSHLDIGKEIKVSIEFTDLLGGQEKISSIATEPIMELELPPILSGVPIGSVTSGDLYTYLPTVTDPNGNSGLHFRLVEGPDWAEINKTTGQIAGVPTGTNRTDDFLVEVTDITGLSARQRFSVSVTESSTQKRTLSIQDSVGLREVVGTNSDNSFSGQTDTIMVGMDGNDVFTSSLGANLQIFVGGPGADRYIIKDRGVMTVVDGGNSSGDVVEAANISLNSDLSAAFTIDKKHLAVGSLSTDDTIYFMNWLEPEHRIEEFIFAGQSYNFSQFKNKVESLNNYIGNLSWTDLANLGFEVVTEGINASSVNELEVIIRKILNNKAPTFESAPNESAKVGYNYRYNISVLDEDAGDVVEIIADHLPSWATFDQDSNVIFGVPDKTSIGQNIFIITARDIYGGEVTQTFFVDVKSANNSPLGKLKITLDEQHNSKIVKIDSSSIVDTDGIGSKQYLLQLYKDNAWVNFRTSADAQFELNTRPIDIPATKVKLVSGPDYTSKISGLSLQMKSHDGFMFKTLPSDNDGVIKSVTTPKGLVEFTASIPNQKLRTKMSYEDLNGYVENIVSEEISLSAVSNAVNISDAISVLKAAVGIQNLTSVQMKIADIDNDESVTISDVIGVLKLAVGINPLEQFIPRNISQEQSVLKLTNFSIDDEFLDVTVCIDHLSLQSLSSAPIVAIDVNATVTAADNSTESMTWNIHDVGDVSPVTQEGHFVLLGDDLLDLESPLGLTELGSFKIAEDNVDDLHKLDFSINFTVELQGQNETINQQGHIYFDGEKVRNNVTDLNTSGDTFVFSILGDVDQSAENLSFVEII